MSWARIDDQIAFHPKVVEAGNEAAGAWMRMLALSCAQLTDGRVADVVAATIAPKRVLERLVAVKLLDRADGAYQIHDFHHWNPPAATVRAKREVERARKATGRANQGRSSNGRVSALCPPGQPADVQPDNPRTSERIPPARPPVPSPSPVPVPDPKEEERESAPPVPSLTETEREVAEAIDAGEDLWPSLPMTEIAETAKRIVRDVAAEPKAAQSGLDAVAAAREAVPRVRAWAKQRTGADEGQRLTHLEVVVGYILVDCRAGKRRPPPGPQRLPPSRAGARQ